MLNYVNFIHYVPKGFYQRALLLVLILSMLVSVFQTLSYGGLMVKVCISENIEKHSMFANHYLKGIYRNSRAVITVWSELQHVKLNCVYLQLEMF